MYYLFSVRITPNTISIRVYLYTIFTKDFRTSLSTHEKVFPLTFF